MNETEQKSLEVRIVLNDVTQKGIGIFSTNPLNIGQSLVLTLDAPFSVNLPCKVAWCQEYNIGSHILSPHSFPFRIGLEFKINTPEEQKAVEVFNQAVQLAFKRAA